MRSEKPVKDKYEFLRSGHFTPNRKEGWQPNYFETMSDGHVKVRLYGDGYDKFMLVDAEDWEYMQYYRWWVKPCYKKHDQHSLNYAFTRLRVNGTTHRVLAHRLIMNTPKRRVTDHYPDQSGLDNRKSNLRIVTYKQNKDNARYVIKSRAA